MPTKKSKKNVKTHNKNTKKDAIIILKKRQLIRFGLIALLILVVCVTLTFTITKSGFNLTNIQNNFVNIFNLNDQSDSVSVDLNNVVAVVNTEEITQGQLDKRYEQLPPTYKGLVTKEDLLVQLIDETILLQEAKKQEIVVTEETVDEYMQNLSIQAGVSFDQFLELLDQNGLTHDDAKEFYKKTITLNVLLYDELFSDLNVNDDEILDYYDNNQNLFVVPESINASHILICHNEGTSCVSELTKDEALAKANEVLSMIDENNFAEIAREYSDGPSGPNGGSLGVFTTGQMVPEFEVPAFALNENEVSDVIETAFGYHIIKVYEKRSEGVIELELVKEQVKQTLLVQKQSDMYSSYVEELRNESVIQNNLI